MNQLPRRERHQLFYSSHFFDSSDALVKVGGRLAKADDCFRRKHPTFIPDTLLGDALIGFLHTSSHYQRSKVISAIVHEEGSFAVGGRR